MSYTDELEDSLQACREIERSLASGEITMGESPKQQPVNMESEKDMNYTQAEEFATNEDAVADEWHEMKSHELDLSFEEEEPKEEKKHRFLRALLSILMCVFVSLILVLFITKYVAYHTFVEGSSMERTLSDDNQIIVEKITYYNEEPKRFDVIVFPQKEGVNYIKRIVGLPGELIQIVNGEVYINGEVLHDPYATEPMEDPGLAKEVILLGENEYFVLGDNRNGSVDSRSADVGTVKRSQIRGKAWLRFYPFSQFGTVK